MKILICGAGSIGTRHAKNLIALKHNVAFHTKRKNSPIKNVLCFKKLTDAFVKFKPEITYITNVTSLHIKTALYAAKKNSAIFIEKPLTNKKTNVKKLVNIIKKKKLLTWSDI